MSGARPLARGPTQLNMTPQHALELTDADSAQAIHNLWPLYLHDLDAYAPKPLNAHGVISEDDEVRSWAELSAGNAAWWKNPGVLFPYLIRAGGRPAGFALVASGAYLPSPDLDWCMHEFFIAHWARGTGVGVAAAREAIARHRGRWEVVTYPGQERPIRFWRKALAACAAAVEETEEDHPFGRKVVFRLDNGGGEAG